MLQELNNFNNALLKRRFLFFDLVFSQRNLLKLRIPIEQLIASGFIKEISPMNFRVRSQKLLFLSIKKHLLKG